MLDIFEQLHTISGENTYYLIALNYPEKVNISYYQELFQIIDSSTQIKLLLSTQSWREHLIAYMLIMSNYDNNFVEAIKHCFSQGSDISPQLAVAIALQDRKQALNYFLALIESFQLSNKSLSAISKSIGAIMAVMPTCGGFEISIPKLNLDLDNFNTGFLVACHHLNFWQKNGWEDNYHS
ncbi:hypothetical protein [Alkanindiges illinoisensis]|uniref:hypothetical protein n=1 Tax=Alkanindiges illinoisensis TaxID=197183 RepID=UPI00047C9EFD|nr:hypothetical protein [Alkanindiges illinoisensis]